MFFIFKVLALLFYYYILTICTARFLKYVWPFYNIMHERVKVNNLDPKASGTYNHFLIFVFHSSGILSVFIRRLHLTN